MIIKCYRCEEELVKSGALIFLHPTDSLTKKIHICRGCELDLFNWVNELKEKEKSGYKKI